MDDDLSRQAEAQDASDGLHIWRNATPEEQAEHIARASEWRTGLTDSVKRAGFDSAAEYLENILGESKAGVARITNGWPAQGIDAADLLALDLPPLRWIIPDLLPEGTSILASPPKVGKSCLVYQMVVEVSLGGELFGRRVTPGSALYLALEDGKRRGKDRLAAALQGRTMPHGRLEVRWSARKTGAGLEEDVTDWLDSHNDAVLVAIDTLQRVRPSTNGKRGAYEIDVEDLSRLQDLFRDRAIALVIVHHVRKQAGDDFLESVSGTYGVTGSADTIIVLRRKRLEVFGQVLVTGRDVADAELSVRFENMTWVEAPASLPEASFERKEVYQVIEEFGPIFPAAIAERTGLGRTSVQNMVGKLVDSGNVVRTVKGYVAVALARARVLHIPDDSRDSESHQSQGGHVHAPARETQTPKEMTEDLRRMIREREGRSNASGDLG